MDDNQNKNQPNTNASDYQKILDEYAASVKPDITQPPENLPEEKIPADSLKETVSLPPEPKKITAEVPGKTLADDLEEALIQKKPVEPIKPSPVSESPIHPSLAVNLEENDSVESKPANLPPVSTPKIEPPVENIPEPIKTPINETQTSESKLPQPEKTPEEIKAEINRLLEDDDQSQTSSDSITPKTGSNMGKIFFIFALILFLAVAAGLAYFLFLIPLNSNNSNNSFNSVTPIITKTEDNTGSNTTGSGTCELNDKTYQVGESFASADGCNTCNCSSAGVITCTEKACLSTPTPSTSSATKTTVTPTKTISNIPKDWKTYTDPTYKFSISYPSTWTVNTKSVDNQVVSISSPEKVRSPKTYPEYDYLKIYFYKDYQTSLTNSKTLESYLSNKTDFSSFNKTKIIDINAYLANENGMSNNSYPAYFIINGDNLFEINSDDQSFSESEKQIINTFKFN